MKKIFSVPLSFLIFFSLVMPAKAILNEPEYVGSRVRSLAGAFTAVADDENALFYNPAGLSLINPGLFGHFTANIAGTLNKGGIIAANEIESKGFTSELQKANTGPDSSAYKEANIGLCYFQPNFAIGLFLKPRARTWFMQDGLWVWGTRNLVGIIGLSHKFGNLSVGLAGKGIMADGNVGYLTYTQLKQKGATEKNYVDLVMEDPSSVYGQRGSGWAANAGIMYSLGNYRLGIGVENAFASDMEIEQHTPYYSYKYKLKANKDVFFQNIRYGLAFVTGQTILALDVDNLSNQNNSAVALGLEHVVIGLPVLGNVKARVGAFSDSFENGFSLGTSLRILLAEMDLSFVSKKMNLANLGKTSGEMDDSEFLLNLGAEVSF